MNCDIERTLQQMQAAHPGEHLPLEDILEVLHDEEYGAHFPDVPYLYFKGWHEPK